MSIVIALHTLRSACRHGAPRGYLARLVPGPRGSIGREFIKARKLNANRLLLRAAAMPGDVFEARRWTWDGLRQQYTGGTFWFGIQGDGSAFRLTRDEAFHAVLAPLLTGDTEAPGGVASAERMLPADLLVGVE